MVDSTSGIELDSFIIFSPYCILLSLALCPLHIVDLPSLANYEELSAIVEGILLSGVNLIAIDFDFTLIDDHTRGQWNESVLSLISHVRPVFKTFMLLALQRGELFLLQSNPFSTSS